MKLFLLSFSFVVLSFTAFGEVIDTGKSVHHTAPDTIKLKIEGTHAYYQKTVTADSIPEGLIYVRVVQFMASKNFQQNYGYMEEGKLIFTTTQDLNVNAAYIGDDNEIVTPYTIQFAITLDLKNGKYRYTISNIVFFFPTGNGNKRETMFDIYLKANQSDSRRLLRTYKSVVDSFERYLGTLTDELQDAIEQKSAMYNPKF